MKPESFKTVAARAIDEGGRERQAQVRRLASQFAARPTEFDLRALERLGEDGLAEFLSHVGGNVPCPGDREQGLPLSAGPTLVSGAEESFGWAGERRSEPQWIVRAVLYGWFVSLSMAAIGSVIVGFLNW